MKMNMWNFKELLKKASVNYLIPSVSLQFKDGMVYSNLISSDKNVVSFLSWKDNILNNKKEEIEFNFSEIFSNLKPYLDLIKDEEVEVDIKENSLKLKDSEKKSFNLFFCTKEFTNDFPGKNQTEDMDFFYDKSLNKEVLNRLNQIKKVALKFGKIYFVCKDGKLFIETTDKTNSFSNNVKFELDQVSDKSLDISMCFDYKNLNSIISTIEREIEDFKLKCTYLKDSDAGMVLFENIENNEKYFITSKTE